MSLPSFATALSGLLQWDTTNVLSKNDSNTRPSKTDDIGLIGN